MLSLGNRHETAIEQIKYMTGINPRTLLHQNKANYQYIHQYINSYYNNNRSQSDINMYEFYFLKHISNVVF